MSVHTHARAQTHARTHKYRTYHGTHGALSQAVVSAHDPFGLSFSLKPKKTLTKRIRETQKSTDKTTASTEKTMHNVLPVTAWS